MRKLLLLALLHLVVAGGYGTVPTPCFTPYTGGCVSGSLPGVQAAPAPSSARLSYGLPAAEKGYGVAFDLGYVSFALQTPRNRTTLFPFTEPMIMAGTMMPDGRLLAFTYTETTSGGTQMESMVRLDVTTGIVSEVAKLPAGYPNILDVTYEPVSDKVLALAAWAGDRTPSLVSVDSATGALTVVRKFDNVWYSLAADGSGRVFYVRQSNGDVGVSFNALDGTEPITASSGTADGAAYISSLAMDRDAYQLYWAMCTADGRSHLMMIDPVSGATTNLGTIGTAGVSREVMALNIPSCQPVSGTPSAPSGLTVTASANGALTADARWTNAKADTVSLYLNGILMESFVGVGEGSAGSMALSGLRQGYNHIRLTTANASGKGAYADAYFWAGRDVPRAVTGLTLQRVAPDSAVLTWSAPEGSVHGGYISPTNIKYRITRYSLAGDTAVVQKTFRGTEYREKVPERGSYYYTVQSLSTDYGETATTPVLYLGAPLSLPYRCDFSTLQSYSIWTPRSANGNTRRWIYYSSKPQHVYNPPFAEGNDDWLFSAPLSLEKGKEYYIYLRMKSGLGIYYPKMFDVSLGSDATTAGRIELLRDTLASREIEEIRITATVGETGEYTLAIHDCSPFVSCNLYVYGVTVSEKTTGKVSGYVRDSGGKAVSGATVSLDRTTLTAVSGDDGSYMIDYVEPGTYSLSAYKPGYASYSSSSPLAVESRATLSHDIVMNRSATATLTGIVTDDRGAALPGVKMEFSAEGLAYDCISDTEGRFTISDMSAGEYSYAASRLRFLTSRGTVTAAGNTELSLTMSALDLPPHSLSGTVDDNGAVMLRWNNPRDLFRRDNGSPKSQNGAMAGTDVYLFGSVWRQAAVLNAISWMTTDYQGPHDKMNLWVLDVKADGTPSPTVLYNAMDVPASGDLVWNRHEMAEPVSCPNGFYLAVSYRGMASIAMSDGEDADWPFVPGVNYRSKDYRTDTWTCVDASFVKNNYMLRAEGEGLGLSPCAYDYHYAVWRIPAEAVSDTTRWTLLTPASGVAATGYADVHAGVADGEYVYAVAAIYPGSRMSEPVFSNRICVSDGVAATGIEGFMPTPNPVADVLHLGCTVELAAVYDMAGCLRMQSRDTDVLDMSGIAPGCYLLRVQTGNKVSVIKIIKK